VEHQDHRPGLSGSVAGRIQARCPGIAGGEPNALPAGGVGSGKSGEAARQDKSTQTLLSNQQAIKKMVSRTKTARPNGHLRRIGPLQIAAMSIPHTQILAVGDDLIPVSAETQGSRQRFAGMLDGA